MYSTKYLLNKLIIVVVVLLVSMPQVYAQTYQVNGTAVNNGNGLVKLTTQGANGQVASSWSTTKIDLSQPFDMSFEMFFGCDKGANGGDGITFTLQNSIQGLNAIGAGGGNLGLFGTSPAVSIEFDTFDGSMFGGTNEIAADHIAVELNGNVNVGESFIGSAGTPVTVQPILGGRDLEDCAVNANNFYSIRIVWNPTTKVLQLFEEGTLSMTYTKDLVTDVFGGTNMVYWGFTAATGTADNEQWIAPSGSIIPWECNVATSCCLPYTVTASSPTTICNAPITLSVAGTYTSYNWSTGSTNATTQVSLPGNYTLSVLQNQGGNLCPGSATFTIVPTGATATLSGGATLCSSDLTTPLSIALTGASPWSLTYAIDGISQPAITNITGSPYILQANGTHTYTLVSVLDNSGCIGTVSGTATVNFYTGIPIGHDGHFFTPGTANLTVDNLGGTYNWYDAPTAGNLVFTGDAYTTPVLTGNTTYYVENSAISSSITKSVALLDKTDQSEGAGNDLNDHVPGLPAAVCYLEFTANSNFTLNSINCLVNVPAATVNGQLTIYITPYVGTAPYTGAETVAQNLNNISIATTGQTNILVPLNYACIAGTTYHISYSAGNNIQTEMYFQLLPVTGGYPITSNAELSITQYDAGRPGRYPGLFDWSISVPNPAASCGRNPVTAYVCPNAILTGDATICNDGVTTTNLSVAMTAASPWSLIYAIDGVDQTPVSGITTSPYTFSSTTGAHVYTLTSVSNPTSYGCTNGTSGTATVSVNPAAPTTLGASFINPGSAVLSVENTGGIYNWFTTSTGGTIINVGSTYTTPVLTNTTSYYVQQVVGVDTSCTRSLVIATALSPVVPIFIPNLITPNNDGSNDVFQIKGLPNGSAVGIYNQWGSEVYRSDDYNNQWTASNVVSGIYYYDLKLKNGESYNGWLQILK